MHVTGERKAMNKDVKEKGTQLVAKPDGSSPQGALGEKAGKGHGDQIVGGLKGQPGE